MSDLSKAHETYQNEYILNQIEQTTQQQESTISTIQQTTDILKQTLDTHGKIEKDLKTSNRKLAMMKFIQNKESLLFWSGLIFYVLVIIYILLRRGPIAWIIHSFSGSSPVDTPDIPLPPENL